MNRLDNIIVVAAALKNGLLASYSDIGETIDIAAPSEFKGTFETDRYGSSSYWGQNVVEAGQFSSGTAAFGGTSAAATVITGVVSLMQDVNPELTPLKIREILRQTAKITVKKRQRFIGDEEGEDTPEIPLVDDGKVLDHIRYRARGGVWRYSMTKNMWKFDLNRGHDLEMRDNWGRKYSVPWTKLNLGASIQQGDFNHRGEQGMFESVGFKLFNLAGNPEIGRAHV